MRLPTQDGAAIVRALADAIVANKAWLSEIDGLIGDGDHGVNMAKGFARAAERLGGEDLQGAFATLGDVLLSEIGGSMGPLYGMMFAAMSETARGEALDAGAFGAMLRAGLSEVEATGGAKPGDKTLVDCLAPAVAAFEAEPDFGRALAAMSEAAERGRDATIDLQARLGRSARLGERSRGVLDAGAASCCLILQTLAAEATRRLG